MTDFEQSRLQEGINGKFNGVRKVKSTNEAVILRATLEGSQ